MKKGDQKLASRYTLDNKGMGKGRGYARAAATETVRSRI